jgi:lipopolysaccharide export system protein LptA
MRADCFARASVLIGLLCAGGLSGAPGAAAQGLSLSGVSEDRPIEVSADHGIEWQQDAQVYIARGNAVAKRGTTEVHADTLTAHYRPIKATGDKATGDKATGDKGTGDKGTGDKATGDKATGEGGETEIYRLDADGHVTIKGERQTVVGDQAVYDVDQQIGIVTGKALKMTTATDVVTARDSLEWYDQKQIAVARGDAVAVRDVKVIRADVLTAHMTKDKPPPAAGKPKAAPAAAQAKPRNAATPLGADDESSKISRVDAQGHVLVSTETDVGRGDYGVYNADSGIATLLGNVTVTRGPNTVRGEYAVMDLNNNISRMMAAPATPGTGATPGAGATRVEGLFVRQDQAVAPTGTARGGAPPNSAPKP